MELSIKKSANFLPSIPQKQGSISYLSQNSSQLNSDVSTRFSVRSAENLDSLCLSRKRVLESLKLNNDEISPEFLLQQLEKDESLNTVNKQILSIKFKIACKTKSTKENQAKKALNAIKTKQVLVKKESDAITEEIKAQSDELIKKQKKIEEEKNDFFQRTEKIKEKNEEFKAEIKKKISEFDEVSQDLHELERISAGMIEINKNIEEKMDEKRKEISGIDDSYYQILLESYETADLEQIYAEIMAKKNSSQKKRENITKNFEEVMNPLQNVKNYFKKINELNENLKKTQEFLETILDENEIIESLTKSNKIIEELFSLSNISLDHPLNSVSKEKEEKIDFPLKESESKLNNAIQALKKIESNSISKTFNEIKKQIKDNQEKNDEKIKSFKDQTEVFIQNTKTATENLKKILHENQEKSIELNQIKNKLNSVNTKVNFLVQAKKTDSKKQEELKTEINLLAKKLEKTKSGRFHKENIANEKKLINIVSHVTALHEDIMKKDTQIIKRTRELLKTEEDIKSIEDIIKNMDDKIKATKDEIFNRVGEEIAKKDKEIEMLKEIVKGNTSEIKAKEATLNGIKRQIDRVTPRLQKSNK